VTQHIAVVGLGINNRPLVPFWLERHATVAVFDRRPEAEIWEDLAEFRHHPGLTVVGGPDYLRRLAEWPHLGQVYLTPGMPKTGPEIQQVTARGGHLTCETELFFETCHAPIIGITGSQGKTTTTTLVGEALKRDGRRPVWVGGNIGRSLLPELPRIKASDWVVMELSSFQLELVTRSPQGAAWLNLSPNHLDIHGSFDAYRQAKQHIIEYQTPDHWAVLPADDPAILPSLRHYRGQPVYFSLDRALPHGSYLQDGQLWWAAPDRPPYPVMAASAVRLLGRHNLANALAAIAIVAQAGGSLEALREVLSTFQGVPHRLEQVREVDGVLYINDSIATTPDRTVAALNALERPIVLIAGGYDKHLEYDTLGQAVVQRHVRLVVALGQVRNKIQDAVRQFGEVPVVLADTFEQAFHTAVQASRPGDIVLLSPAAASYDMFRNFEARGQRFRELVQALPEAVS